MKKIYSILLALVMLAIPATVVAQFRYAPVVGVNITDLKFKQELFPVDKMVGFQAGIMGELMFPGLGFGMDFGLLYNQAGAKTDHGTRQKWKADGFGKETAQVHMLQIPVHLRFKWTRMNGLEDYIAPFVYGGPEFGINIAHSNIKGNAGVPNPYEYAGGDLGMTAGGGAEIFKRWQVSLQYTWGLTYMLKTRKLENVSAQNRQWTVRVAYFF